jgi:hypothetical protein
MVREGARDGPDWSRGPAPPVGYVGLSSPLGPSGVDGAPGNRHRGLTAGGSLIVEPATAGVKNEGTGDPLAPIP